MSQNTAVAGLTRAERTTGFCLKRPKGILVPNFFLTLPYGWTFLNNGEKGFLRHFRFQKLTEVSSLALLTLCAWLFYSQKCAFSWMPLVRSEKSWPLLTQAPIRAMWVLWLHWFRQRISADHHLWSCACKPEAHALHRVFLVPRDDPSILPLLSNGPRDALLAIVMSNLFSAYQRPHSLV